MSPLKAQGTFCPVPRPVPLVSTPITPFTPSTLAFTSVDDFNLLRPRLRVLHVLRPFILFLLIVPLRIPLAKSPNLPLLQLEQIIHALKGPASCLWDEEPRADAAERRDGGKERKSSCRGEAAG
jgi:hypothetical protein